MSRYMIHAFLAGFGVAAVMVATEDYPKRVAFAVLLQMAQDYVKAQGQSKNWQSVTTDNATPYAAIDALLVKVQDPANCDNIIKIQKQLDDTKEILHETIVKVGWFVCLWFVCLCLAFGFVCLCVWFVCWRFVFSFSHLHFGV